MKLDKIIKTDNEILEVKIQKISNDDVEFSYPNESIKNLLNTNLIKTIVFASGRIQNFESKNVESSKPKEFLVEEENNVQKTSSIASESIEPNTIAVLPINFYDKNNGVFLEQNAYLAQQQTIDFLMKQSNNILPLKMIDSRRCNSLLKKRNINISDIDNTSIEDLHNIVRTEYLVIIKVAYTIKRSNSRFNIKDKDLDFGNIDEDLNYEYEIIMDVYKDREIIYKKTRVPFWNFKDSWLDAVKYLIERAPFYHD